MSSYAEANVPSQFDLDVILVIDHSGSMSWADPNKLALTAANLFIDMNFGSDSRVGYVMYSHYIVAQRGLTDLVSFSRDIKNEISAMEYGGWTDIALGVETALEIFANEPDRSRTPAIILLSDGNTSLEVPSGVQPRPIRSTVESNLALLYAVDNAASMGVPIFTVGFNHNGELDIATMELMARQTGGFSRETVIANDLPIIMFDIYSHLTGARGDDVIVETVPADGNMSVTIPIRDSSIHRAIVTIMSNQPVQDVALLDPSGAAGTFTQNSDASQLYTLITIMHPTMGDWVLSFVGTPGTTVSINFLSIYDVTFVFDLPRTAPEEATFSWRLENDMGADITDSYLLNLLYPSIFIRNLDTDEEIQLNFAAGQQSLTAQLPEGHYEAYMILDSHGILRESNLHTFTIHEFNPPPIPSPIGLRDGIYHVTLTTIFNPRTEISINNLVNFNPENRPITVSPIAGVWGNYVEWDFHSFDETIVLSALRAGRTEIPVNVQDVHGQTVTVIISVNIINGLVFVVIVLAVIIGIALLVITFMQTKKPKLNDPMSKLYIKMTLPASMAHDTPPEYALVLPAVKGKKTLRELINMNMSISEPYRVAMQSIGWFADNAILSAKSKSLLEIKIPQNAGYTIKVDKNAGKTAVAFNRNGGTEIRVGTMGGSGYDEYDEFVITLGNPPAFGGNTQIDYSDGFDTGTTNKNATTNDDNFW